MLLVSPNLFNREVVNKRKLSLERDMHAILNKKRLSTDQKWNRYKRILDNYLSAIAEDKKPIGIPIIENTTTITKKRKRIPSPERSRRVVPKVEPPPTEPVENPIHKLREEQAEIDRKWENFIKRLDRSQKLVESVPIQPAKPARFTVATPRSIPRRSQRKLKPKVPWTPHP